MALAAAGLILFFVPLLCLIPYYFVEKGFSPTDALKPPADLFSYVAALGYIAIIWPSTISDVRAAWIDRKPKPLLQGVGLVVLTPVFGWAVLQAFFSGPLSYLLHNVHSSEASVRTVAVVRADDFGHSRCRNRAILEDGAMFWRTIVCGLSAEALEQLRRGGQMRIEGRFSRYGMQVQRYTVVGAA